MSHDGAISTKINKSMSASTRILFRQVWPSPSLADDLNHGPIRGVTLNCVTERKRYLPSVRRSYVTGDGARVPENGQAATFAVGSAAQGSRTKYKALFWLDYLFFSLKCNELSQLPPSASLRTLFVPNGAIQRAGVVSIKHNGRKRIKAHRHKKHIKQWCRQIKTPIKN